MKRILVALAAVAFAAGAASAANPKCPLMKHEVANPKTALKTTYKGKTVYFCCAGCKPAFEGKSAAEKDKLAAQFGVAEKPAKKKGATPAAAAAKKPA